MKYLFGPVNSRRLGLSQGIDLLPSGICNFNCIYCEVNLPKKLTLERREYFSTEDILAEINTIFSDPERAAAIDVFTLTASGEPTLHSGIGAIIRFIKEKTVKPVTVLTNGALLHLKDVREDLAKADIVVPSLDAARLKTFQKINRPALGTDLQKIMEGIAGFRQQFSGQLWLEILLAQGINDRDEDIKALKNAITRIKPDKVQLNTVVRPPIESFARPVCESDLRYIAEKLGNNVEIVASYTKKDGESTKNVGQSEIIELLKRRPGTEADICQSLRLKTKDIRQLLAKMAKENKIVITKHAGQDYWTIGTKEE